MISFNVKIKSLLVLLLLLLLGRDVFAAQPFKWLRRKLPSRKVEQFQQEDGGVALVGLGEATGTDRANDAIRNALNSPLLEVEWSGATGALIHITGGPDMSLAESNKVGELVSDKMSPDANVIWGARVDPRLSGVLRVMLILTGVKSPQLLPRSKEESGISVATKRLAEFGIIGTKTATVGSAQARERAYGKIPETTRGTWEDRLKPLERTLASRKKKAPTPKRDLEELGLKKLLE